MALAITDLAPSRLELCAGFALQQPHRVPPIGQSLLMLQGTSAGSPV